MHRAEILQLHGAWPDALDEAQRACDAACRRRPPSRRSAWPSTSWPSCTGCGGRATQAEEAYRQASHRGRPPAARPGPAAAGPGPARGGGHAMRRVLDECTGPGQPVQGAGAPTSRSRWPAHDLAAARGSADELAAVAAALDCAVPATPPPAQATGAVAAGRRRRPVGAAPRSAGRGRRGGSSRRRTRRRAVRRPDRARLPGARRRRHRGDGARRGACRCSPHLGAAPDLARRRRARPRPASRRPRGLSGARAAGARRSSPPARPTGPSPPSWYQREDRRPPREQHLHQARRVLPGRRPRPTPTSTTSS